MPNKENIKIWVDALRSGDYRQTQHFLNREGMYCCVGVACELAIANKVAIKKYIHGSVSRPEITTIGYGPNDCTSGMDFPPKLCKWLGIDANDLFAFARMNDKGASFAAIADAIEETYL